MQVSIIPKDKTIVLDGEAIIFDYRLWSKKIHAIQWNGVNGQVEYTEGAATWFDNFELIAEVVDEAIAERDRLAEIARLAELARLEAEAKAAAEAVIENA